MFLYLLDFEIIQYVYMVIIRFLIIGMSGEPQYAAGVVTCMVADIGMVCDYEQRLNQSFLAHLGLNFHATVYASVHFQYPHIS